MKIEQVFYEIFESDAMKLDRDGTPGFHGLDREVRLHLESGEDVFISWGWDKAMYRIRMGTESFFTPPPPVIRDMSDSDMWKKIVGQEVKITFLDEYHQVLEIRSNTETVYCWSSPFYETGSDVVIISRAKPDESMRKVWEYWM